MDETVADSQPEEQDERLIRVLRDAKAHLLRDLRASGIQPSSELADPAEGGSTSAMFARINEQASRDERYDLTPKIKAVMVADALICAMSDSGRHKELGYRTLLNMDRANLQRAGLAEEELRRLDGTDARRPGAGLNPEYVIQVIAEHMHVGGNGNGEADLAEQRKQAIATARATLQVTPPPKPPGGPDG